MCNLAAKSKCCGQAKEAKMTPKRTEESVLDKERTMILCVLCASILVAPFYSVIWSGFALISLCVLQTWQWLSPGLVGTREAARKKLTVDVKKRVKIVEKDNEYISQRPLRLHGEEQTMLTDGATVSLQLNGQELCPHISVRGYNDVKVVVTGLRISGGGCSGGGQAEYKLQVTTPDGKTWPVWRSYDSIFRIHRILERVLENDITRNSILRRIVPSIPSRSPSTAAVLFESKRSIMNRRRTGLNEFICRIFGDKSEDHYRKLAVRLPQVREFLELSTAQAQNASAKEGRQRKSIWPRPFRFWNRRRRPRRGTSSSYYLSSESEEQEELEQDAGTMPFWELSK